MKFPKPSIKQTILIVIFFIIIIVGSGFLTNRKSGNSNETSAFLAEQKQSQINRLSRFDNHLNNISTPVSVKREQNLDNN